MCGIAGCFHVGGEPCRTAIDGQLACLRHRGPDAIGARSEAGATIGQTRLAIIDLVTGDPPMSDESGTIHAVLNGEIYNFLALREELARAGHILVSRGDTEVLAHLAEEHDAVELARRLEGMFAFAIFDGRRRRLILGRDRFGVKPLYYWHRNGTLVFGSEAKAVLSHPGVPRELDHGVIPAYLTLGYAPTPRTFYDGIVMVPPAHVVVVEEGRDPVLSRYWSSPLVSGDRPIRPTSEHDAPLRVRRLLDAAVQRRLVSDVPLGAYLSGGVDSSAVVALMALHSPSPVRTFTIGFDDTDGYDERRYARLVATRYKTDHTEFVVKPDAPELIEDLVDHHDGPFGDSSALPTYLLAKLTRQNVTVALCGDGGDEMFCGYERFAAALLLGSLARMPRPVGDALAATVGAIHRMVDSPTMARAERMLAQRHLTPEGAFFRWMNYVSPEWMDKLLSSGMFDPLSTGLAEAHFVECLARVASGASLLQRIQQSNIDTYLLDDLLPKVDRASMAHGLEVRSPFLDREMAEDALTLPDSAKVRGPSLKRVLKEAVSDLLPAEILHRRKHGFGVPLERWFRTDLRGFLEARLCSQSSSLRRLLVPESIDELVAAHMAGRDLGSALWTLLTLEVFLRREGW